MYNFLKYRPLTNVLSKAIREREQSHVHEAAKL